MFAIAQIEKFRLVLEILKIHLKSYTVGLEILQRVFFCMYLIQIGNN